MKVHEAEKEPSRLRRVRIPGTVRTPSPKARPRQDSGGKRHTALSATSG